MPAKGRAMIGENLLLHQRQRRRGSTWHRETIVKGVSCIRIRIGDPVKDKNTTVGHAYYYFLLKYYLKLTVNKLAKGAE
jgi:hypothetical protein